MTDTQAPDHAQPHRHPPQPDIEDAPLTHYQAMSRAVIELLVEAEVFGAQDLRRTLEMLDSKSPALGARLVARAWLDPAFEARLLADTNAAAAELDIDAGTVPVVTVKNTPTLHNVIVCTLCSCYPRMLLGFSPDWYKSRAYRSRVVREPRAVLAEFGTAVPDGIELRVHDSTADLRYMVLPLRPAGTEGWDEAALAALVTRDSMIGTAVPEVP